MVQRFNRTTHSTRATRHLATDERLVERRSPDGSPDPVARSAYARRYESEFAGRVLTSCTPEEVESAALQADLVLLGEYHPLPGAAEHAETLLHRFVREGIRPRLGVEFAQGRDQRALDAFAAREIAAQELRERIAWEREWGYPWRPARRLLERARELGVPVEGLDVAPRGGTRDLAVRDRVVAARLARRLHAGDRPLIVVFGEAHLAAAHLPSALERELVSGGAASPRIVRVLHDLPTEGSPGSGSTWSIGESTFVTFPAGPAAREGALAQVWKTWAAARRSPRLEEEALLHALARMQLDALGLDSRRTRLPGGGVLADLFPRLLRLEDAEAGLKSCVGTEGVAFLESEGVVLAREGSVDLLALGAGDFCAAALAARASLKRRRPSEEGTLLLACVGAALARLADPVTDDAKKSAEAAFARSARLPDSPEQARLLGGALGREALRGRFRAAALARSCRRAHAGARSAREALGALVSGAL